MSVSVVVAAYNAQAFIARAIRSALEETSLPIEVIVVDDRSSDGTVATVRALAAEDPRVKLLVREENGGPAAARNAGFAAATGDWIAVLDADDAFTSGRLARLVAVAEAHGADLAADNVSFYDAPSGEISGPGVTPTGTGVRRIDARLFMAQARPYTGSMDWGLLKPIFRRAFVEAHGLRYPQDVRHGEDFLLVVEALLQGAVYVLSDAPGYIYTLRSSGMSRTRIDYDGMARQTRALLADPRIAADTELARRVRARARAVRRLAAERRFDQNLAERKALRLLSSVLVDPYGAKRLLGRALAAVRRRAIRT